MPVRMLLAAVVALIATASVSGCKGKKAINVRVGSEPRARVAYVARSLADPFSAWLADSVREEAEGHPGVAVDVFDGQGDDAIENKLIENAIANRYDVVVIHPNDAEAQRPFACKVVKAGIICITTSFRIDGIPGSSSVDADPYMQAKANAQKAVEQVARNANVVVLNGPANNIHSAERRRGWQKEFFDKRPDVSIAGEGAADWDRDKALDLMGSWAQSSGRIDAVIAMNDNMAAGAIEAIRFNPKFDGMLVYGVDGTAEACALIKEGRMTSTCMQSAPALARGIFEVIAQIVSGERKTADLLIDGVLIDKSNVDEFIGVAGLSAI